MRKGCYTIYVDPPRSVGFTRLAGVGRASGALFIRNPENKNTYCYLLVNATKQTMAYPPNITVGTM